MAAVMGEKRGLGLNPVLLLASHTFNIRVLKVGALLSVQTVNTLRICLVLCPLVSSDSLLAICCHGCLSQGTIGSCPTATAPAPAAKLSCSQESGAAVFGWHLQNRDPAVSFHERWGERWGVRVTQFITDSNVYLWANLAVWLLLDWLLEVGDGLAFIFCVHNSLKMVI